MTDFYIEDQIQQLMSDVDPDAVYFKEGSGRVVFINRDLDVVYKIAKSEQGIYQNRQEYTCSKENPTAVPTVHEAVTVNDKDYVLLTVDVAHDYLHYIIEASNDLQCHVERVYPDKDFESVRDMQDILAAYPVNDVHPTHPKRHYFEQFAYYLDTTPDTRIIRPDLNDTIEEAIPHLLSEAHPNVNIERVIPINEINNENIGFKALPDGSFIPQVIDAGINDWGNFRDFQNLFDTEAPLTYY